MTQKYEKLTEWETRGGWRAVVVGGTHVEGEILVYHDDSDDSVQIHKADGTVIGSHVNEFHDLLRPWVEKRSGWVNVYFDPTPVRAEQAIGVALEGGAPDEYLKSTHRKLLARVKWTEGDGV